MGLCNATTSLASFTLSFTFSFTLTIPFPTSLIFPVNFCVVSLLGDRTAALKGTNRCLTRWAE